MGIEELSEVRIMKRLRKHGLMLLIFPSLYVIAFVTVHRSSTLRRPAYNMMYWYYSDHVALEAVEFYSFWPLRQITYRVFPGFMSRHIRERTWQTNVYPPGFAG